MPPVALCKSFDPCCFGRFDVVAVVDAAAALSFVVVSVVDAVFFYYFGKSSEQKYALNRNFILQKYGNKLKVVDFEFYCGNQFEELC